MSSLRLPGIPGSMGPHFLPKASRNPWFHGPTFSPYSFREILVPPSIYWSTKYLERNDTFSPLSHNSASGGSELLGLSGATALWNVRMVSFLCWSFRSVKPTYYHVFVLDKEKEMLCSESSSHLANILQEDLFLRPNFCSYSFSRNRRFQ